MDIFWDGTQFNLKVEHMDIFWDETQFNLKVPIRVSSAALKLNLLIPFHKGSPKMSSPLPRVTQPGHSYSLP